VHGHELLQTVETESFACDEWAVLVVLVMCISLNAAEIMWRDSRSHFAASSRAFAVVIFFLVWVLYYNQYRPSHTDNIHCVVVFVGAAGLCCVSWRCRSSSTSGQRQGRPPQHFVLCCWQVQYTSPRLVASHDYTHISSSTCIPCNK
jgi:TRAP-type uncharacterized transport system fused permease subunit